MTFFLVCAGLFLLTISGALLYALWLFGRVVTLILTK